MLKHLYRAKMKRFFSIDSSKFIALFCSLFLFPTMGFALQCKDLLNASSSSISKNSSAIAPSTGPSSNRDRGQIGNDAQTHARSLFSSLESAFDASPTHEKEFIVASLGLLQELSLRQSALQSNALSSGFQHKSFDFANQSGSTIKLLHILNQFQQRILPLNKEIEATVDLQNGLFDSAPGDREIRKLVEEELILLKEKARAELRSMRPHLLGFLGLTGNEVIVEVNPTKGRSFTSKHISELVEMYKNHARSMKWKVDTISEHYVDGELRHSVLRIQGEDAFTLLNYEKGDHRFMEFGEQGRASSSVYTNFAQVQVYKPVPNQKLVIDFRRYSETFLRASGPGGQNVNKVNSAVFAEYVCEDGEIITAKVDSERDQGINRQTALMMITSKLVLKQKTAEDKLKRAARAAGRSNEVVTNEKSRYRRTYDSTLNRNPSVELLLDSSGKLLSADMTSFLDRAANLRIKDFLPRISTGQFDSAL